MAADIKNDASLGASTLAGVWCTTTTVTEDVHTTAHTLTDNNTVTTATGKQGTASQFVAANSEYLSLADHADVSPTGDCSIALWMYLDSAVTGWQPFITKDTGAPNRSYAFALREVTGDNFEVVFSVDGSNGTTNNYRIAAGMTFSTATWYHIVMAFDNTAHTVKCYVNGTLQATIVSTSTNLFDSTATFQIGAYTTNSVYFDGRMNQVLFYRKLLDATNASDLYNGGVGIPYEAAASTNTGFFQMF